MDDAVARDDDADGAGEDRAFLLLDDGAEEDDEAGDERADRFLGEREAMRLEMRTREEEEEEGAERAGREEGEAEGAGEDEDEADHAGDDAAGDGVDDSTSLISSPSSSDDE